jgi:hypothetical protein
VGARGGSIPEANATTTTLFATAGPGYRIPVGASLELGTRADIALLQHSATRRGPTAATQSRWIGAVDLMLELGWSFRQHAGIVGGVGTELAFGSTTVSVGGAPVATIPPMRGIAELGARFRF